jgi:hypothetical protein
MTCILHYTIDSLDWILALGNERWLL